MFAIVLTLLVSLFVLLFGYWFSFPLLVVNPILMLIPGAIAWAFAKRDKISISIDGAKAGSWKLAVGLPYLLALIAFCVSGMFTSISLPDQVLEAYKRFGFSNIQVSAIFFSIMFLLAPLVAIIKLPFTLSEEYLWRGYIFEKYKHLGFWKASFLIGIFWFVWQTLILGFVGLRSPQQPLEGMLFGALYTLLASPIFLYIRIRAGALIPIAFFQGLLHTLVGNASVGFSTAQLLGPVGISGYIVLVGMNAFLYFRRRDVWESLGQDVDVCPT